MKIDHFEKLNRTLNPGKMIMQKIVVGLALVLVSTFVGCGDSNTITLPTDKLTAEQEAQVKMEDQRVEDEESQGQLKKKAKKK